MAAAGRAQGQGGRPRACSEPSPNTNFCMERRRSSDSSSPMLNSRNTTPSSARCRTPSTSRTMPSACGPISAPPAYAPRPPRVGMPASGRQAGALRHAARRAASGSCPCAWFVAGRMRAWRARTPGAQWPGMAQHHAHAGPTRRAAAAGSATGQARRAGPRQRGAADGPGRPGARQEAEHGAAAGERADDGHGHHAGQQQPAALHQALGAVRDGHARGQLRQAPLGLRAPVRVTLANPITIPLACARRARAALRHAPGPPQQRQQRRVRSAVTVRVPRRALNRAGPGAMLVQQSER